MGSSGLPIVAISDNLIFSTSLKWTHLLILTYHAHFANYLRFLKYKGVYCLFYKSMSTNNLKNSRQKKAMDQRPSPCTWCLTGLAIRQSSNGLFVSHAVLRWELGSQLGPWPKDARFTEFIAYKNFTHFHKYVWITNFELFTHGRIIFSTRSPL
jgi:hypothetical protein